MTICESAEGEMDVRRRVGGERRTASEGFMSQTCFALREL
jgi:hypothetical protein